MLKRMRAAGLLGPAVMTVMALALLLALGFWQLERLKWKEGLIRDIAARTAAAPQSLEETLRAYESGRDIEYTRVSVKGRFLHDKERYLYAPDQQEGLGYQVLTPLEAHPSGLIVFINRGFVPDALKDPAKRPAGLVEGQTEVVGLVRLGAAKGAFTPENDVRGNLWYWRDLPALANSAFPGGDRTVAPFVLDSEAPSTAGGWPRGGTTILTLPNRHLEYALTWFGLAAALVVIFGLYAVPRLRTHRSGAP